MQHFTYEITSRSLVWPTRRTVVCVHCKQTSLYTTFWLTKSCLCV